MTVTRHSFLQIVAIVLFIVAAVFFFIVPSIRNSIDLGLVAVGLAVTVAAAV